MIQKTEKLGERILCSSQSLSFTPRQEISEHGFLRHDSQRLDGTHHIKME